MSSANPPADLFVSERIAGALRAGDDDAMAAISPIAACIMPLLGALGWRSFTRDIIEALPHFAAHLDLPGLRNVLVNLGYESAPHATRLDELDTSLLPCLFISKRGEAYVVTDRRSGDRAGEFVYFDAQTRTHRSGPIPGGGTAYVFTEIQSDGVAGPAEEWFSALVRRFQSLVRHLLGMTLVLNVITLTVPLFIMIVYDRVIGSNSLQALPFLVGGMVFVLGIELALRLLRARTLGLIAGRLDYLIGVETFRQIIHLAPQFTERSSVSAQLVTLKQFDAVRDFFTGNTAALALEAPFVLLFVAVIWSIAGWIALIPVTMIGLYALFALAWLPRMNREVARAGAARTARQQMLMETFSGLREIKSLCVQGVWQSRFREFSAETMSALYRTGTSQAVLESVTYSMTTLAGVGVLALGTRQVMQSELSIGALIAIMALLWRVLGPIQGLFLAYVKFDHVGQGIRALNQLMKLETEPNSGKSALLAPDVGGAVRFDRVSFRYGPGSDPALVGCSFSIRPGEFVAVLGENGSGKSTLLKLVAGMYTAQSGSVLIDDIDTRQFNPMDLRRVVAYVPQNPVLFHGTVAQNLRLKNVMATDAELESAAAKAGVLDLIRTLPRGFNTRIGDADTDRLPTGLVHGLCLARAFVRAAPVLLLDEPGASLDHDNDVALVQQLKRLKGTQTVLMVSHRPSHIRLADKAVVVGRGMIRFVGTPDEAIALMRRGDAA